MPYLLKQQESLYSTEDIIIRYPSIIRYHLHYSILIPQHTMTLASVSISSVSSTTSLIVLVF